VLPEEVFPVAAEQLHLDLTVNSMDDFLNNFESEVSKVDFPFQRKALEGIRDTYETNRAEPYYGVFADASDGKTRYVRIGRNSVFDASKNAIVVNWTTDEGQKHIQIERDGSDLTASARVEIVDDRVTAIIESNAQKADRRRKRSQAVKSGELTDIIDLVNPEQDDLVRIDHAGGLVIEGGPGTGKTVVALQRIAYLLLRGSENPFSDADVLVVGPTAAYSKYVQAFLPGLGIGRVRNEDFQSICLARFSPGEAQDFSNLAEESDGIVRTKNSANVLRVIQGGIWPAEKSFDFQATINLGSGRQEVRYLESEDLLAEVKTQYQRFQEGAISYVQAQDALKQRLQNLFLQDRSSDPAKSARTSEARRAELFELWIMKIGMHSLQDRARWKALLDSPAGGRHKRAMSALMSDYYQRDIEIAIDLIAESAEIDIDQLRDALVELEAPRKRGNGRADEIADTSEVEMFAVEIAESDFGRARDGRILNEIEQLSVRLLPNVNALTLARRICRGDGELYERVLGKAGRTVATRLAEVAVERSGGRAYTWTVADLPIVAEVKYLVEGNVGVPRYSNVVVDEAQDLTRLQARVISRLVRGSLVTLVGDLNQATRSGNLGSWLAIGSELGVDDLRIETLSQNYRVPQNIYDYARMYLSEEDRIDTPTCDIEGGTVVLEDVPQDRAVSVLEQKIRELAVGGQRVVVISEDLSVKEKVMGWALPNTDFLTPEESKGLEVDHAILFQPNRWFRDVGRIRNLMYVVCTRATKSVTVLQHEPERFGIYSPQVDFAD
jgi:DNA helicase IV